MFLPSDSISEVIAHFIGCFEIRVDEMRMRHAYEEFWREQNLMPAEPIPYLSPGFFQHLQLDAFIPGVAYRPSHLRDDVDLESRTARIDIKEGVLAGVIWTPQAGPVLWPVPAGAAAQTGPYLGLEPSSVMLSANQVMLLDDNDFLVLGNADVGAMRFLADAEPMQVLLQTGLAVSSALGSIAAPENEGKIPAYFAHAETVIAAIAQGQNSDGTTVVNTHTHQQSDGLTHDITTVTGPALNGLYVDGLPADLLPSLEDALPDQLQALVDDPEPAATTDIVFTIDPDDVSITLESGANMMVNEAVVGNAGLSSAFLAVAGDYHAINAIIQTNVYSDIDTVDSRLPGATANAANGTAAHNIASFNADPRDTAAEMAAQNPGAFPSNWQVSVVEGDMVFLDWIAQYSFTSDGDTHVLSAVGTTTTISSGENLGLNSVSFTDLGHYYDLIIVGGSLYDGNVIIQTNVLYDNDTLAMLSGSAQDGGVSSSGNLLWNSASILNVGASNLLSGMPDIYGQAIASLGAADYSMPGSFSSEVSFEGFETLRVLFIAGNLYDLHAIQQVNVMGDADLVAVYENNLTSHPSSAEWSISTGSNALINVASIIDYDSVGSDVHVGGQIYSDAILIQADLVASSDAAPASNDALVSEVIAFLDIDLDAEAPSGMDLPIMPAGDGPSADIMQSVLA
ncbi:MAG: hypothetical protein JWP99_220 [Devosia sp.]|nr:hypothetical protein [Devosia sp.]